MGYIIEVFKHSFSKNYLLSDDSPKKYKRNRELIIKTINKKRGTNFNIFDVIDESIILEDFDNIDRKDSVLKYIGIYDLLNMNLPQIFFSAKSIAFWIDAMKNDSIADEIIDKLPDDLKYSKDILNKYVNVKMVEATSFNLYHLDETKVEKELLKQYKLKYFQNIISNNKNIEKDIINSDFFIDNFDDIMGILIDNNYTSVGTVSKLLDLQNYQDILAQKYEYFRLISARDSYKYIYKEEIPLAVVSEFNKLNKNVLDILVGKNDEFVKKFTDIKLSKIMINVLNVASSHCNLSEFIGGFIPLFCSDSYLLLRNDLIKNIDELNEKDYSLLYNLMKGHINIRENGENNYEIASLEELRNIEYIAYQKYENIINNSADINQVKNVILLKNYGLNLLDSRYLFNIYAKGIIEMNNCDVLVNAINAIGLIISSTDIETLKNTHISPVYDLFNLINRFYSTMYSAHEYGVEGESVNETGVEVYESNGVIKGTARMIVPNFNVNSKNFHMSSVGMGSGSLQYRKDLCFSYITQDRLEQGNVYMLFNDISSYNITVISRGDVHSQMISSAGIDFRGTDYDYVSPKELLTLSGNISTKEDCMGIHNELIIDTINGSGKLCPNQILYYGKKEDNNYLYALKAASEWGIPLIFADVDKISQKNRIDLESQYETFKNITIHSYMSKNTFLDIQIFLKNYNIYRIKHPSEKLNIDEIVIDRLNNEFSNITYAQIDKKRSELKIIESDIVKAETHIVESPMKILSPYEALSSSIVSIFRHEINQLLKDAGAIMKVEYDKIIIILSNNESVTFNFDLNNTMIENLRYANTKINILVHEQEKSFEDDNNKVL